MLKAPEPGCTFHESHIHDERITKALSTSQMVVLAGYKDGESQYEWTLEALAEIANVNVDNFRVEWQCRRLIYLVILWPD